MENNLAESHKRRKLSDISDVEHKNSSPNPKETGNIIEKSELFECLPIEDQKSDCEPEEKRIMTSKSELSSMSMLNNPVDTQSSVDQEILRDYKTPPIHTLPMRTDSNETVLSNLQSENCQPCSQTDVNTTIDLCAQHPDVMMLDVAEDDDPNEDILDTQINNQINRVEAFLRKDRLKITKKSS